MIEQRVSDMIKSDEARFCSKFSALRSEWFDSILPSNAAAEMQGGCTICEHFVNVARIYGRSGVSLKPINGKSTDGNDDRSDSLFSSQSTSREDDSSMDIAKESERTRGESSGKWTSLAIPKGDAASEELGSICDLSFYENGDGKTGLAHAIEKCGGSPFAFLEKEKNQDTQERKQSFLQVAAGLHIRGPLDVALALSDIKGSSGTLGLTPLQKEWVGKINQKRVKAETMPKMCDGVQLAPGQIESIEAQLVCIRKAMRSGGNEVSPTRKQCSETIKRLQPLLVSQLRALESASGAPSVTAKTISGDVNYARVVSQIEALKMKVFSPSSFTRPECPNPDALQDYLFFPQRGGQWDLCVDIGFCSTEQAISQVGYVHSLVSQNELWIGSNIDATVSKITPPGINAPAKSSASKL